MRLTEELILLMLDERSDYLEMVPGWDFSCALLPKFESVFNVVTEFRFFLILRKLGNKHES